MDKMSEPYYQNDFIAISVCDVSTFLRFSKKTITKVFSINLS